MINKKTAGGTSGTTTNGECMETMLHYTTDIRFIHYQDYGVIRWQWTRPRLRLITSIQNSMWICVVICPCVVWTPPHNSLELRGLLVAVGRCNTQVRLSLTYVPGKPPRPPVPRIPLRKVLRSVTHKQDARIVNKVYCWMLQSSELLSVFKPDTLSGVLTLFNDHNLSYYQKN